MFEFQYNPNTNIIVVTHTGPMDLEILKKLKAAMQTEFGHLTEVNILLDYRKAQFHFVSNTFAIDVSEMIELIPGEEENNAHLRIACVPGNAENQMINQLYHLMTEELEYYNYKLFETYEDAMHWLENP